VRIGIVGAGMIGSTLAKLWVDAGHEVRLASRHPENLQPLVERLGTRASAGTPMDVATFGDVVMLTVPLKAVPDLARDLAPSLAGKVVLDTGNAYERRDGDVARLASQHPQGSATVYFKTLASEAHRESDRLGIPLAGDDTTALETAAGLVRDAGFDPVIAGSLARGKGFEPDTRPYNTGMSGPELRTVFGQASTGSDRHAEAPP
jgi:predicted dinucleotide-binding enzyme